MGLNLFGSFSSYDNTNKNFNPNPNPKNCKIVKSISYSEYLIVLVNYPDCTNYEGNKILVYYKVTLEELEKQHKAVGLDPHFSQGTKYFSPIARFKPDDSGWYYARRMCE